MCYFSGNTEAGVDISGSATVNLVQCTIKEIAKIGISVAAATCAVSESEVSENEVISLSLCNSSTMTI